MVIEFGNISGSYNRNGKPSKARSMHAAHIAVHGEFVTLIDNIISLKLSAKFYPEHGPVMQTALVP